MVFLGDLVLIAALQFHASTIDKEFDFDKTKAAEQRKKIYAEAFVRKLYDCGKSYFFSRP